MKRIVLNIDINAHIKNKNNDLLDDINNDENVHKSDLLNIKHDNLVYKDKPSYSVINSSSFIKNDTSSNSTYHKVKSLTNNVNEIANVKQATNTLEVTHSKQFKKNILSDLSTNNIRDKKK